MSPLDLLLCGLVAVFRKAKDCVVILVLSLLSVCLSLSPEKVLTNLPILRISLQHHRVFSLADLAIVHILGLLCLFLCLNTLVFGESALVSLLPKLLAGLCLLLEFLAHTLRASARKWAPTGSMLLCVGCESLPSGLKLPSADQSAGTLRSL